MRQHMPRRHIARVERLWDMTERFSCIVLFWLAPSHKRVTCVSMHAIPAGQRSEGADGTLSLNDSASSMQETMRGVQPIPLRRQLGAHSQDFHR